MDSNGTAQRSATMPLLPVSYNPSISNPHMSLSITSRFTAKLVLLHRILLFVLGIITLLCVAMATSLVPQPPKIKLNSLFVSKINVSNTKLGANFDVAFTIENPNLVSWIRFDRIDGSISYKDNALVTYSLDPFVLGLKEHRMMRVKISVNGLQEDQPVVKERVWKKSIGNVKMVL
ncbi:uncharacterized protein Pyn_03767 [Prunus yedoensis var. nudiflora]|uniref:Late embryogenesis abundant protein LEA-2 subgroup domain-containing protein n=1 Tax=Prunus yedoensis var. nudiflora TaxID=2094558 RepID=A0A314V0X3_PRUYE|nr:uncharacterized protein Pyn_03767 [Prunus yedoensis var. nudiflora]